MKDKKALRKAAILIDMLDAANADALLEQMPLEQAAQVRAAVMALDEVSMAERIQILEEFKGTTKRSPAATDNGIEIDDSLAMKIAASRQNPQPVAEEPETAEAPPFRFLHQAATDTVAKFLRNEHPQTVAVIVSHLSPERAAQVLAGLPGELQADVLQRVVQLSDTDEEIIREIESEIETALADQLRMTDRRSAGLAAASAILKAADLQDRRDMLANLGACDAELAELLQSGNRSPASPAPTAARTTGGLAPYRCGIRSPAPTADHDDNDDVPDAQSWTVEFPIETEQAEPDVEFAFDDLAALDDASLAAVFQAADPNVALLALTGANNAIVKRILKQLPSRDAKQLKKAIEQVGPVQLRDIDRAQQQLADLAASLASSRKIHTPAARRFAAAA